MEASPSARQTTARRYALALLSAAVALGLREVLSGAYGTTNPYHTVWAAVVFSSLYCGLGPAILTTFISLIGVWYLFVLPQYSFGLANPSTAIAGMIGFLALSGVIITIGEGNRRLRQSLNQARQELEQRVRQRTAELEQSASELLQKATMLDLANDGIFLRDFDGKISYWNEGAERLYGWTKAEAIGRSTYELLRTEYPEPLEDILRQDTWEGELRHTKRDGTQIVVASRWTRLRDVFGKAAGWLELNTDITARKRAEESARKLTGRLLTLQDEEHRKIARDLHDSLGQYLAALKMSLDALARSNSNSSEIGECSGLVDKCLSETRTISHLLHPPLLDEAGLRSALQWYVQGFAQRSGINIKLDLPLELDRFHKDVETALFRVVQEALTNVHRHSGASEVNIHLELIDGNVRLIVEDNGMGIPKQKLHELQSDGGTGVGLAGMRERMRELSGSFRINSDQTGTSLTVAIPIFEATQAPGGNPNAIFSTSSRE